MKNIFYSLSLLILSACSSSELAVTESVPKEFYQKCQVKLLTHGRHALKYRIQLLRSAKKSIDLQTFIWSDDECGRILMHECMMAAKRGVQVRLLCDHLFSNQNPQILASISQTANLHIKIYNPATETLKPETLELLLYSIGSFHKVNQRMHNKLLLVDGKSAVCGGRNIENTYYDNSTEVNYKDLDIAVRGSVCRAMKASFEKFWKSPLSIPLTSLKDVATEINKNNPAIDLSIANSPLYKVIEKDQLAGWHEGFVEVEKMAFFSDLPGKNSRKSFSGSSRLNDIIVAALNKAEQRIWIQSPYLVFSDRAESLFSKLKGKKLDIKISTNSLAATDSWPTYAFLYKQKKMFVDKLGIQIYEFNPLPADLLNFIPAYSYLLRQKSPLNALPQSLPSADILLYPRLCLHSKCMLIDDDISFIGSYNLDPRSANLNTELSVVIVDKNFNKLLARHIAIDRAAGNSWVVARRKTLIGLKQINALLAGISEFGSKITGIDLWPRRYTSCFELKKGAAEVSPAHKDFYKNYRAMGNFPCVGKLSEKEILTRFFKMFGQVLKPII